MARFETTRVLRFGDCDPAGIAYYPRYFDLLNGVVEDWWISMGHPWRVLFGKRRITLEFFLRGVGGVLDAFFERHDPAVGWKRELPIALVSFGVGQPEFGFEG